MTDEATLKRMAEAKKRWDMARDAAPEMLSILRELEHCWSEHVDEWRRGRCAFVNTDHDVLTARLKVALDKLGRAEPKAEKKP